MKHLWQLVIIGFVLFSTSSAFAKDGSVIKRVTRPFSGYGEWAIHMHEAGKDFKCRLVNLQRNGSSWIIECPDGNYRISRTFKHHYKIVKEGEKSGYISKSGYFIHTQLSEIKPLNPKKYNQWRVQESNTLLKASFSDLKEWQATFIDLRGVNEGKMIMTWSFKNLKDITVKDSVYATSEQMKKNKFLVLFATIISSIKAKI